MNKIKVRNHTQQWHGTHRSQEEGTRKDKPSFHSFFKNTPLSLYSSEREKKQKGDYEELSLLLYTVLATVRRDHNLTPVHSYLSFFLFSFFFGRWGDEDPFTRCKRKAKKKKKRGGPYAMN